MRNPEFVNCKRCKKLFAKFGSESYCEPCRPEEDVLFRTVRDFLYKHPNSTVAAVVEATGVCHTKIFEYVTEGRVTAVNLDGSEIGGGRF